MPVLANSAISQDAYQAESEKIRERFEHSHNGQAAIQERSNLTDSLISELWNQVSPGSPTGFASPRLEDMAGGRYFRTPTSISLPARIGPE